MTRDEAVQVFMRDPQYVNHRLWAEIAFIFRYGTQPTKTDLAQFVRDGASGNFWEQGMRAHHG